MKKLNYILITFLILFLNNISFGQFEQEQCLSIVNNTINLSLNEGDEVDITLNIQNNGVPPSFQGGISTVKIVGPQKLESSRERFSITPPDIDINVNLNKFFRDIIANNTTFSAEDVGQYTVTVEKEGCFTNTGFINLSLVDENTYCHLPSILLKENKDYIDGDKLNFYVRKYATDKIASVDDLEINITGPNGYNSGDIQWTDDTLNKIFNINNNLALADSGWYYVTFTQTGCSTVVDSVKINVTSGLKLPFNETFDEMLTTTDYNNFIFKGPYNNRPKRKSNWFSLNEISKEYTYNSLIHSADSAITTPDTIVLPKLVTNDNFYKSDPNLKLIFNFDVSHLLRDSTSNSYDTLILKAYLGNNPTPIQLYKKGGFNLRTDETLDTAKSSFIPDNPHGYLWRTETLFLQNIDTVSTMRFFFILKPSIYDFYTTPSNNVLLDNIKIEYAKSIQNYSFGNVTIVADSLYNRDRTHTITINVPNNHNGESVALHSIQKGVSSILRGFILSSQNDTTFTYNSQYNQNGQTHYVVSMLDTTGIMRKYFYENKIIVKTSCKPPISAPVRFIVDSSFNRDRKYKLSVFLPPNHNSDIIKFYDNDSLIKVKQNLNYNRPYTYKTAIPNGDSVVVESKPNIISPNTTVELLNDSNIFIQNFQNGSRTIEYVRSNAPNGLHRHTVALGSTDVGYYSYFDDDSLRLVYYGDTLDVIVDTITIPIGDASLITDVATTNDGKYNLTLTIPTRHNAFKYDLLENGVVIASDFLTTNNRTTVKIPFQEKTRGTYTYAVRLTNKTGQITNSNLTVNSGYFKPPVINARACTTNRLVAPNRKRTNFTYSFTLNDNCPTNSYKALFYSGQNVTGVSASNPDLTQTQLNRLTWRPEGGSPRNSGLPNGNIAFTRNEITSKVFNRVASPLPGLANRWYKIEIQCTSCSQTNRKRVGYFFVTN